MYNIGIDTCHSVMAARPEPSHVGFIIKGLPIALSHHYKIIECSRKVRNDTSGLVHAENIYQYVKKDNPVGDPVKKINASNLGLDNTAIADLDHIDKLLKFRGASLVYIRKSNAVELEETLRHNNKLIELGVGKPIINLALNPIDRTINKDNFITLIRTKLVEHMPEIKKVAAEGVDDEEEPDIEDNVEYMPENISEQSPSLSETLYESPPGSPPPPPGSPPSSSDIIIKNKDKDTNIEEGTHMSDVGYTEGKPALKLAQDDMTELHYKKLHRIYGNMLVNDKFYPLSHGAVKHVTKYHNKDLIHCGRKVTRPFEDRCFKNTALATRFYTYNRK